MARDVTGALTWQGEVLAEHDALEPISQVFQFDRDPSPGINDQHVEVNATGRSCLETDGCVGVLDLDLPGESVSEVGLGVEHGALRSESAHQQG